MVCQRVRFGLIRDALPPAPARVCELGVGGGWLLHCLYEEGYDVRGCDVNLAGFPSESPIADRILLTSGARLPFPDNHFDAVYSCDVLEHVFPEERTSFLDELIRVTKPGGVVALTAFFHSTWAFRFWGVGYLFFRGTLPSWYTEHLTIPNPSEEQTLAHLSRHLTNIKRVPYQRAVHLLVHWLQTMAPQQGMLARLFHIPRHLIPRCDVLGRTTSTFFTGLKRK